MNINATLIWQVVAFAILVWFTLRFVWPPLMKALDERAQKIADGLAAAERGKQEMQMAERKIDELLAEAKQRAADILSQTEKQSARLLEESRAHAQAEGNRLKAAAQAEIEQSILRAKEELRHQLADLVVVGAERVLRGSIDAKQHADVVHQLRQEL